MRLALAVGEQAFEAALALRHREVAARALKDAGIQTKGDLMVVFTVEEELGLLGARAFLEDWRRS